MKEAENLSWLISEILNRAIREKRGRLTMISDMCGINRSELTIEGISKMKFDRVVRLCKAVAYVLPEDCYNQMKTDISTIIQKHLSDIDGYFLSK